MAQHNVSPVREQIRNEMLAALAKGAAMTATELYALCPSATESTEIARIAHDMRRTGKLDTGEQVIHPLGMRVNTYRLPTTEDPRIEASKPIKVERKIPKTGKANKPRASNPYAQFTVSKPQEEPARITRDLPIHLQSAAPVAALEAPMSEDPTECVPDPDSFALEPSELESLEGVDSDLAQALFAMSQMDDVGEITEAMAKKHCQCAKIAAPPKMPDGFRYAVFSTEIHSEDDDSYLSFETGGPESGTIILSARGDLTFDMDEINMIPEVAAFLNNLHISE